MYEDQMQPAFAGMKADAGFDRVETRPANDAIDFGVVVGEMAGGKVAKGKQTQALGVAVHDHLGSIKKGHAVSVMTQGVIWMKVAANKTIAKGAVKYDANGELDSTASETLAKAKVLEVHGSVAKVELNHPTL